MPREVFSYKTRNGEELYWSGLGLCICTQCEKIFVNERSFTTHQRVGRKCLDVTKSDRFTINDRGHWTTNVSLKKGKSLN